MLSLLNDFALLLLLSLIQLIYVCQINSAENNDCPIIKMKRHWGGLPSKEVEYRSIPVKYVIIHHTTTPECETFDECSEFIRNIQTYHMSSLGFYDIGYNFLVGNDGRIYEGVGWLQIGAHTYGYNTNGTGIAFIGDYRDKLPSAKALRAVKKLLKCGASDGYLSKNYILLGGRQVISTESPGLTLYKEIQKWNHWSEDA